MSVLLKMLKEYWIEILFMLLILVLASYYLRNDSVINRIFLPVLILTIGISWWNVGNIRGSEKVVKRYRQLLADYKVLTNEHRNLISTYEDYITEVDRLFGIMARTVSEFISEVDEKFSIGIENLELLKALTNGLIAENENLEKIIKKDVKPSAKTSLDIACIEWANRGYMPGYDMSEFLDDFYKQYGFFISQPQFKRALRDAENRQLIQKINNRYRTKD